jgi:hypothetical protein
MKNASTLNIVRAIVLCAAIGAIAVISAVLYDQYSRNEATKSQPTSECIDQVIDFVTEINAVYDLYVAAFSLVNDDSLNLALVKTQQAEDILIGIDPVPCEINTFISWVNINIAIENLQVSAKLQQEGRDGRQEILESMQRYESATDTLENLLDEYGKLIDKLN